MLKFLLIFFIVIYLLGYVGKLVFIYWIKKIAHQQMNQNVYEQKKEGEVTINQNPKNPKKYNTSNAEYVDYEEIKD